MKRLIITILIFNVPTQTEDKIYEFTEEQVGAALSISGLGQIFLPSVAIPELIGRYNWLEFSHKLQRLAERAENPMQSDRHNNFEKNLCEYTPTFLNELFKPSQNYCCVLSANNRDYRKITQHLKKEFQWLYDRKTERLTWGYIRNAYTMPELASAMVAIQKIKAREVDITRRDRRLKKERKAGVELLECAIKNLSNQNNPELKRRLERNYRDTRYRESGDEYAVNVIMVQRALEASSRIRGNNLTIVE